MQFMQFWIKTLTLPPNDGDTSTGRKDSPLYLLLNGINSLVPRNTDPSSTKPTFGIRKVYMQMYLGC